MAMGIKVIDLNTGKPMGFIKGFFRELANRLTFLTAGILYIPFNSEKKGIHDMIFRTRVVKVEKIEF